MNKKILMSALCLLCMALRPAGAAAETEDAKNMPVDAAIQTEDTKMTADDVSARAEEILQGMTPEEKAAQIIITTPESLTGSGQVTAAGDVTKEALGRIPLGGLIYFEYNLISPEQTREMITAAQEYSLERTGLPLLICVDEEGGSVTRIAGNSAFGVTDVGDMCYLGQSGDAEAACEAGAYIGSYLRELGFNVNLAPVADVLTNPGNTVVADRSFGPSAVVDAMMVEQFVKGASQAGIVSALKHFPGHGDTTADSHDGEAVTYRTKEDMVSCEWIPFSAGIEAGCDMVMVGHISAPELTGDDTPASLSRTVITDILKDELEFDGIVITDALNMGAVANRYSSAQAACMALNAGVDILLMPADLSGAVSGIAEGISSGTLSQERLDDAVRKVIELKLRLSRQEEASAQSPVSDGH